MKTKEAFCANDQEVTTHIVTIDLDGEYLFTCPCGRFFKLAGDLDKKGVEEALQAHEEANIGQITQAEIEKINEEKLSIFDDVEVSK